MPKLSEILMEDNEKESKNTEETTKLDKSESSEKGTVKLSDVISEEAEIQANDPVQLKANDIASKIRQFAGTSLLSSTLSKDPSKLQESIGTMIEGGLNTASFGIPKAITKKILQMNALDYPEPKDKVAKTVGEMIGLIQPTKMAMAVTQAIPGLAGRGLAKSMMKGAAEGAMVGFTTSPDEFMDIKQRIAQSQFGAVVGAVAEPVAHGFQNIGKIGFKSKEFAEKVRNTLFESKKSIGKTFESQLDDLITSNPSKVVDLEQPFLNLKKLSETNTRLVGDLKSAAKRSGLDPQLIDGFIKNPESAKSMTLNQSREIKKLVSEVPSIKMNLKKGKFANYSDTDVDLLDFADEVKGSQLNSFPELAEINKIYSDKMTKYNAIKDKFRVGKLLDNIGKNFGDKEVQAIVKDILPGEIIKEMGGYRAALKTLNALKWVSIVGIGSTVVNQVGRNIMSGVNNQ